MSLIELLLHHGWHFIHSDEWVTPDDRVVDWSEALQWGIRTRQSKGELR